MKRFLTLLFCLSLLLLHPDARGQALNDFGFEQWSDLPVNMQGVQMRNAWAGGLNNVQFGKYDLDGDGLDDLLVFDRHGDRLLPFIFSRQDQEAVYTYAPYYRRFFPALNHWFQVADYNGDGKPDIFTYTPGGIMVYKNTGDHTPQFEKAVDPYITSLQGSIYTNLLVTYVDYPVIDDLDGDGDLDILTFWGLGSWVELHRNRSVEETGSADSLLFRKETGCWGRFAENPESNIIYLDTCYAGGGFRAPANDPKHTGSTFCLIDIDGNEVLDLLLGDVDYPDPAPLINAGSNMEASMAEQLPQYPLTDPVYLWSFPLVQHIDITNSGRKDLVASPFDPSLVKSRGSDCVWLYEDVSSGPVPEFELVDKSFLQHTMIDLGLGAYPVFADVNGDGLTDMVAGNYGLFDTCLVNNSGQLKCYYYSRLYLFLNGGTPESPVFTLADDDFGGISELMIQGAYPAFADLDGDGDMDMLLGSDSGKILFFENTAGAGAVPVFAEPIPDYQQIAVESFSTLVLFDFDGDGDADLITGGSRGRLSYYRNEGGAGQPVFSLVTGFWGGVDVTDYQLSYTGYSVPAFIRNGSGELNLLVGSETGIITRYNNLSTETGALFNKEDVHFMYISEGIRTSPAVADLNADGYPDLAVGNYGGGIALFKGKNPGPAGIPESYGESASRVLVAPNPAMDMTKVTILSDGDWSVDIINVYGALVKTIPAVGHQTIQLGWDDLPSGIYSIVCTKAGSPRAKTAVKLVVIR
ncbi:Repeat domain in Vibrio, Colwellia, Bradyrhizobium and Shewanella [anaerobic digester metagenome]